MTEQNLPESIFGKEINLDDLPMASKDVCDGYKHVIDTRGPAATYTLYSRQSGPYNYDETLPFFDKDAPYVGERRVNRAKVEKNRAANKAARKARRR